MITSNDYRLNLFTGDIGVTVETDDGPKVAFGRGGIRTFPRSRIGDHVKVCAMTIHKSQGSQFDEVVVALSTESSRPLTRELLCAAVTRASDGVTLVGGEAVVGQGLAVSLNAPRPGCAVVGEWFLGQSTLPVWELRIGLKPLLYLGFGPNCGTILVNRHPERSEGSGPVKTRQPAS